MPNIGSYWLNKVKKIGTLGSYLPFRLNVRGQLEAPSPTSLLARHCKKLVLPLPLAPMRPYLRPMVSSIEQSCMSSTPLRPMLKPSILMSLDVGRDVKTPVTALCDSSIDFSFAVPLISRSAKPFATPLRFASLCKETKQQQTHHLSWPLRLNLCESCHTSTQ